MLVDAYSKRIFNLSYQFAGSYEEAEDLTQEIFLKLFGSLSKYDFEKNFSAWLLTLSRNHLIDNYRKTKWEKKTRDEFSEHHLSADAASGPEEIAIQQENKKAIWDGFNHLSSEVRMAVILRDIQGKKYEEIADIMDLPVGTIKSRISRGRIQLAKILKERKEAKDGM
jgi:RNA polymerase sigma-70 factor (ECF subfamily)